MALRDNVTLYYKLDGNSTDRIGSNNGTDTNITYNAGNGKIVQGAGFNGSSSKITTPYMIPYGDFSINVWVKVDNNSGTQQIIEYRKTTDGNPIVEIYNDATNINLRLRSNAGTGIATASKAVPSSGSFHMITATYNNSTNEMTMQIDAGTAGTSSYTGGTWANINSGHIGNNVADSNYLSGAIDELGIWTRVLSGSEVTSLYNGGAGIAYPFETFSTTETTTLTESLTVLRGKTFTTTETASLTESITSLAPTVLWTKQLKSSSSWTNQNES